MSVITISRGSYSRGVEVAEKVAQTLGYECISREVLLEASEAFHIPEIKLLHAVRDAPSALDRFVYGKEKYISYIQTALLKHVQKDNVVYHGFAGHFFIKDIAHVLKVRIIADLEDRIRLLMDRDGVPRLKAGRLLKKVDDERRKWSRSLYGMDPWDVELYDMVLHVGRSYAAVVLVEGTVEDAVEMICRAIASGRFRTTAASQKEMDELVLASLVKAALVDLKPDIETSARDGKAFITTTAQASEQPLLARQIEERAKGVNGVKEVEVHFSLPQPYGE